MKRTSRRFLIGALVLASALLWAVSSPAPERVEALYSRSFYPALAKALVPLTNSVSWSWGGILVVTLPLLSLAWLALSWRRRRTALSWAVGTLWRVSVTLGVVYLLFISLWGANYRRTSIETQFTLSEAATTEAEVLAFVELLGDIITREADAPRDEAQALAALSASLKTVVTEVTGVTPTLPERVKRLPAGSLLLSGRATGVVSPLTLEPHIDGALPSVFYLAVGAHELAHVAGYAAEADADFIAAVAGLRAEDPFARYATALRLWQSAVWQLPAGEQRRLYGELPSVAQGDLEAVQSALARYQLPQVLTDLQRRTYDRYLKAQGVEAGVADYSRTTQLLIAAQRQGILRPRP